MRGAMSSAGTLMWQTSSGAACLKTQMLQVGGVLVRLLWQAVLWPVLLLVACCKRTLFVVWIKGEV
jgi:hypothetical protein